MKTVMAAIVAVLAALIGAASASAATATLTPAADAETYSVHPDTGYGTTGYMRVNNSGTWEYRSYVRFDLSQLPAGATINSETLRLHVRTESPGRVVLYQATSDTFGDDVTWNTRPGLGTSLGDLPDAASGSYAETSVPAQSDSFALRQPTYAAQEVFDTHESATPPQLVVDYTPALDASDFASLALPDSLFPIWHAQLAADAPLRDNSATLAANLRAQMQWHVAGGTPGAEWFSTGSCAHPTYVIPDGLPHQRVYLRSTFHDSSGVITEDQAMAEGYPTAWVDGGIAFWDLAQDLYTNGVPFPPNWHPNNCPDAHVAIYQPSQNSYWDFEATKPVDAARNNAPSISWGGHMDDANTNPGYYHNLNYTPPHRTQWFTYGASATSLPLAAGAISREDFDRGFANHALNIAVAHAACPSSNHYWPAQRNDCQTSSVPVQEGSWFRLPADVDVDAYVAAFHPQNQSTLTPDEDAKARKTLRIIMTALRDYGAVVTDQTGGGITLYFRDYGITDGKVSWGSYIPSTGRVFPNEYWNAIPMDQIEVVQKP